MSEIDASIDYLTPEEVRELAQLNSGSEEGRRQRARLHARARRRKWVAGQPKRAGSCRDISLVDRATIDRFWSWVDKRQPTDCWLWVGAINPTGYGAAYAGKSNGPMLAHRLAMLIKVGELPEGQVVDHICRNRACCNPDHLRLISNRENVIIGVGPSACNARKTHCHRGHEFTVENTYHHKSGVRDCRECRRQSGAAFRARKKSEANAEVTP